MREKGESVKGSVTISRSGESVKLWTEPRRSDLDKFACIITFQLKKQEGKFV